MSIATSKITPCLWFDSEAEEAAKFYCTVFDNSRITYVSHYGEEGRDIHGKPAGSVMAVMFELDGQKFSALNGGPRVKFDDAISLQIECADQNEVDYYWAKLTAGGEERPCGWLKDKFGLSWQVVPAVLYEMLTDKDHAASQRVMHAFMQMTKYDIAVLERAFEGTAQ
ncbi:VOC family protein [Methyloceanibacter sp.]|uniref:VOC family protein n=1 Tax=Methyloceanibacter sp. TaxID=1965321 RepID=UPI002C94B41D|nr:VOC family protein [Methyloceanibacter sp.]HML93627.1 VOC family protein [Methyloceanibacter sp.]